jgi:hypothetical protein
MPLIEFMEGFVSNTRVGMYQPFLPIPEFVAFPDSFMSASVMVIFPLYPTVMTLLITIPVYPMVVSLIVFPPIVPDIEFSEYFEFAPVIVYPARSPFPFTAPGEPPPSVVTFAPVTVVVYEPFMASTPVIWIAIDSVMMIVFVHPP